MRTKMKIERKIAIAKRSERQHKEALKKAKKTA